MGKPSTHLSRKSSTCSNSTMSKEKGRIPSVSKKHLKKRKRYRQKIRHSISKLFKHLKDNSKNASQINLDESMSVIEIDDTQNTVLVGNDQNCVSTTLNEQQTTDSAEQSCILIPDDDLTHGTSAPSQQFSLHHSTPKKNVSLDNAILSWSNNNTSKENLNKHVNVTKEINPDSYLTIDLTMDTGLNQSEPTVIDLASTVDHDNDVTIVSTSNLSNASSMSGDSEVTVLQQSMSRKLRNYTKGIANLNTTEKGKLLEIITKTIFNGCDIPVQVQNSTAKLRKSVSRTPETAEDTYIKEVILRGHTSRNSIGSNVYNPERQRGLRTGLRMVVIDGSNVAMSHGGGQRFSVRGLQICIDYFLRKKHVVKAFVPRFRCKSGMSTNGRLLDLLERHGLVVYTPSREVNGRTVTPYDDRYIIQCAAEFDGVIVSGDNFRDLVEENARWRFVIENRLLPFTWVNDMIMFPKDPLGRNGPSLEQFLSHGPPHQQTNLNPPTYHL